MALGLGIDTGGTYTDGVIFDFETGRVLQREKRLTTPNDLSEGIGNLLSALDPKLLRGVSMVALSTTLATNACVEGRGSRAALILLGYDPVLVDRLSAEYGLDNAHEVHVIAGSHNQRGGVIAMPDMAEVDRICEGLNHRVDAVGVAEYWGVRDPEFERQVKARVREVTHLPVAAAHELSAEINSMRRAASTLVNARLISLIDELLAAVRAALDACGVTAPLMVVRGDGSLMTEQFARECPVETMLSGPAASVTGAMKLSGARDMVAVDIGGTTTDLAVVRDGRVQLVSDGVDVGGWRTGTRAIDITTIGLGGDSSISWSSKDGLTLSPVRALPLCALAARRPEIKDLLADMAAEDKHCSYARGVFFITHRALPRHMALTRDEQRALDALADRPLSIEQLAAALGTRPYLMRLDRLESLGAVLRSTVTPTDAMHAMNTFREFDAEASQLGIKLMAKQAEMADEELIERALDLAGEKLHHLIAGALMKRALRKPTDEPRTMALGYHPAGDELDIIYRVRIPIVGIGAPAGLLLPRATARLDAQLVLPQDYGVANAVGAITGSVLVEEQAHIRPHHDALGISGYSAHTSTGQFYSEDIAECEKWAEREVREVALLKAVRMGAAEPTVELERINHTGQAGDEARHSLLLEVKLIARATGRVNIA